jgi:hypothetical protein
VSDYRILDSFTLLAAIETMAWDRADMAANPDEWTRPADSAAFLDVHLEDARDELARRERLRNRPFAPNVPDRDLDLTDLKARVDLVEYINRYSPVRLVKRGRQFVGCCPLPGHDDSSPSFVVNPEKALFYCHGCLRGGDIFNFVLILLDCKTFGDAIDIVAREAGIERAPRRMAAASHRPRERTVRVG